MNQQAKTNIYKLDANDPRFDVDAAARFVELMRGDANTEMQFRTLPESPEAMERLSRLSADEVKTKRRNYPGSLRALAPLFQRMNMSGHGIFIALNEFDGQGRKKENLVAAHVIPLDLDGAPLPETWEVQPHWIQETSSGRYQCFFVIERTTDVARVEKIAHRLAAHYQGDRSVHDATHVFRVPGFFHQKGKPFQVRVIVENTFEPPHPLSDFDFLPELETPRLASRPTGIGTLTAELAAEILGQLDVSKFADNASWLSLMMAMHAASGDDADVRDACMDWSDQDTDHNYSRDSNLTRWASFRLDKHSLRGTGTLKKICRDHGVREPTLRKLDAASEFPPIDDEEAAEGGRAADEPMMWDMILANEMVAYVQRRMLDGGAPIYQTGGRVVYPVRTNQPSTDGDEVRRPPGALTVEDVRSPRMQLFMIEHTRFVKMSRGGVTPFAAPESLAKLCLAAPDLWQFPTLNGIISAPTLRADGTLLVTSGYDAKSGLLLDTGGITFPTIEEEPSREAALSALKMLQEPFKDFPCIKDGPNGSSASRAVLLSMVLTGLVRRTLPTAPVHGVSAPTPGTGKTLAIQSASTIVLGRQVTAMSQGASEEEDEKRLFSVLKQGDGVIMIDNVTRPISGDALCTVLTEQTWQSRILGESRNVSVNTNALFTVTGNNLVFGGDMTRRALLCRMDAGLENPEGRAFDKDLRSWVPTHRPELVAAGLTVLRAFVCAGRPGLSNLQPFGSFEAWSNLVRGALVWLGEPDPCITRKHVVADDPIKAQLAAFFAAVYDAMLGDWFTAAELLKEADNPEAADSDLRDILYAAVPKPNPISLGRYLKSHNSKIIGGLTLQVRQDKHAKSAEYRIVDV